MKKYHQFSIAIILTILTQSSFAGEKVIRGDRACNTLTVNGSLFKGKTFKSSSLVGQVSVEDAIKRASQRLVSDGWKISNADEKLGIISADTTVSYGSGKTSPLGITLAQKEKSLSVNISYSISGATTASSKSIAKQFCAIVDAVKD